jgi:hypothetical protein
MTRTAAALLIAVLATAPARADEAELERVEQPPHLGLRVYDLLLLRPLGLVQLAVGAVALVPSYPVAWFLGGQDDVVEACVTDPARRTFARPLGEL